MSDERNEPEVVLNEAAQRFEIRDGDDVAVLEYRLRAGDHLVLTHTGVPERMEGKGIGTLLARTALECARQRGLRVVPLCSFVQAYLQRHPEFADLVDAQKR
jgi:predicted GNAT family acetyltransferase